MAELLQFGDEGFHHVAVDLALTEAFVFGSVAGSLHGVPLVYADSDHSHLLSGVFSKYPIHLYYALGGYAFPFHDVDQRKGSIFGEYVNFIKCKKVV